MPQTPLTELGIKVIALDVYGTVLASNGDDSVPPREGIGVFLDKCDDAGILVVGSSDVDPLKVQRDLRICYQRHPSYDLCVRRFADFFHLNDLPYKNFKHVYKTLGITNLELLVIGDDPDKDIRGATVFECFYIQNPRYIVKHAQCLIDARPEVYDDGFQNDPLAGDFDFGIIRV